MLSIKLSNTLNQNYDLEEKFYNDLIEGRDLKSSLAEKVSLANFSNTQRIKVLDKLIEFNHGDLALNLYANNNFRKLLYLEQAEYLNRLYDYGKVKEFFLKSKLLCELLLSNKLYSCLSQFIEMYQDILGNRFDFKLIELLFSLECRDIKKVERLINRELDIYYVNKVNIMEVERLYDILEQYGFDSSRINYLKLKLKLILALNNRYKVLPKEIVDFMLHSEDFYDYIIVGALIEPDKRVSLKPLLLKKKPKNLKNLFYSKLYNKIFNIKLIQKEESLINEDHNSKAFEEQADYEEVIDVSKESFSKEEIYIPSIHEKKIIQAFSCDAELIVNQDMVLSFLFLEQYSVADYLLSKISIDKMNYERAFVKLKMNNYSECILLINNYLGTNEKVPAQESLFYLKAMAFEKQGDYKSALNSLREVNKRNPNFKQVKRKILSYEKYK